MTTSGTPTSTPTGEQSQCVSTAIEPSPGSRRRAGEPSSIEFTGKVDPALPFDPIAAARTNWAGREWPFPDRMAAATSVVRLHQLLLQRCDDALRALDLTFARYEVLVLLTFSRTGAMPMGKVGERLQVSPASVTNAIDRLEASGFVQRQGHPTDGRAVLAAITDAGRGVVDVATAALARAEFGLEGLDDERARALFDLVEPLRAAAGDFPR